MKKTCLTVILIVAAMAIAVNGVAAGQVMSRKEFRRAVLTSYLSDQVRNGAQARLHSLPRRWLKRHLLAIQHYAPKLSDLCAASSYLLALEGFDVRRNVERLSHQDESQLYYVRTNAVYALSLLFKKEPRDFIYRAIIEYRGDGETGELQCDVLVEALVRAPRVALRTVARDRVLRKNAVNLILYGISGIPNERADVLRVLKTALHDHDAAIRRCAKKILLVVQASDSN